MHYQSTVVTILKLRIRKHKKEVLIEDLNVECLSLLKVFKGSVRTPQTALSVHIYDNTGIHFILVFFWLLEYKLFNVIINKYEIQALAE